MNYVNSFNLFGIDAKQIPSINGEGAPTTETEGAVGCLYMDTTNGDMYKCTAIANGTYTWVVLGSGDGSSITVDTELSTTSTNPVGNKAVTTRLNILIGGIVRFYISKNNIIDYKYLFRPEDSSSTVATYADVYDIITSGRPIKAHCIFETANNKSDYVVAENVYLDGLSGDNHIVFNFGKHGHIRLYLSDNFIYDTTPIISDYVNTAITSNQLVVTFADANSASHNSTQIFNHINAGGTVVFKYNDNVYGSLSHVDASYGAANFEVYLEDDSEFATGIYRLIVWDDASMAIMPLHEEIASTGLMIVNEDPSRPGYSNYEVSEINAHIKKGGTAVFLSGTAVWPLTNCSGNNAIFSGNTGEDILILQAVEIYEGNNISYVEYERFYGKPVLKVTLEGIGYDLDWDTEIYPHLEAGGTVVLAEPTTSGENIYNLVSYDSSAATFTYAQQGQDHRVEKFIVYDIAGRDGYAFKKEIPIDTMVVSAVGWQNGDLVATHNSLQISQYVKNGGRVIFKEEITDRGGELLYYTYCNFLYAEEDGSARFLCIDPESGLRYINISDEAFITYENINTGSSSGATIMPTVDTAYSTTSNNAIANSVVARDSNLLWSRMQTAENNITANRVVKVNENNTVGPDTALIAADTLIDGMATGLRPIVVYNNDVYTVSGTDTLEDAIFYSCFKIPVNSQQQEFGVSFIKQTDVDLELIQGMYIPAVSAMDTTVRNTLAYTEIIARLNALEGLENGAF